MGKELNGPVTMNKATTKEAHWARAAGLVTTWGIANAFHPAKRNTEAHRD